MITSTSTQAEVTEWFDRTYARKAFRYLRPFQAYPVYLQLLGCRPGDALLDVGCGPGHLLRAATLRGLRATGVDVSAEALDIAARYVPEATLQLGNAEELPFPDESFDHVTGIGVIERFLDRRAALREMQRVAKPDGALCFMVRNSRTIGWRVWREWLGRRNTRGHQDALDLHAWRALFDECGLVEQSVHADQWPRQRWRHLLRGKPDPTASEKIVTPLLPLEFANEFIFVLRKR